MCVRARVSVCVVLFAGQFAPDHVKIRTREAIENLQLIFVFSGCPILFAGRFAPARGLYCALEARVRETETASPYIVSPETETASPYIYASPETEAASPYIYASPETETAPRLGPCCRRGAAT